MPQEHHHRLAEGKSQHERAKTSEILKQTRTLDLLCTSSKTFKRDSHWKFTYFYPEIFRTYKDQQQFLCHNFFLLLVHSSIPAHVGIRGGEKQPACCLSRTLSSHLILHEHHSWLPNLSSCSWPQPGKISVSRTAWLRGEWESGEKKREKKKFSLLHWAHLVGRGLKRCSFILWPVQQVVWAETITTHLPPGGCVSLPASLVFQCTFWSCHS